MSTDLNEMQFELLPSLDADSGVVFGIGANISIDDGGFIPGDDDWENEDQSNPNRGGLNFGRDTLNGPTHGFNLHVNREYVEDAVESLGEFKSAWRALHIRRTPGKIVAVRYRVADRVRKFYGRPRRFSAPPSNMILNGYVPITCDFTAVNGYFYDDDEQSISLGLRTSSDGGFTFPTIFPTTTLPVGSGQQQAVVGGDAPTYPVIRFNGPVVNPSLVHTDWTLKLSRSIAADEYVDIDLRPWAINVLLNGNSSVAGDLDRHTYLADMTLEPGRHDFTFWGATDVGGASCEVRWSNAWNSF